MDDDALGEGVIGGYVRCYVPAERDEEAIAVVDGVLDEVGVRRVAVEWCVRDDAVDWDEPGSVEGRALVAEARATGQVVLGEFHVWSNEEED